jgi:hypothetical protein
MPSQMAVLDCGIPDRFFTWADFVSRGHIINYNLYAWCSDNREAIFRTATSPTQNTSVALPLNTWSHVAVTWTPNGGNFDIRFYVNGTQSGNVSTIPNSYPRMFLYISLILPGWTGKGIYWRSKDLGSDLSQVDKASYVRFKPRIKYLHRAEHGTFDSNLLDCRRQPE